MFSWNDSFATKIELVDTQHKALFDLIRALSESYQQEQTNEDLINEALLQLVAYADKHFTEEEELMVESKVDARHVNIHRMEHKSFAYDIQKMRDHLSAEFDLAELAAQLVSFVSSWLTYHILGIDQIMAAQIFAIQKGASPEEAYETRHLVTYDTAVTRLMHDSMLELWRNAVEHGNRLEAKLAQMTQRAQATEFLGSLKLGSTNLHPHFIIDEDGTRLQAVLPVNEYLKLVENLENIASLAARK